MTFPDSFDLKSPYVPCGDQPQAIDALAQGVIEGKRAQVLLGVTGSGKTFTMANIIQKVQKPTLVIAHNKTLAAQLFQEFKNFFPNNAVEYFVSYYDYYQPEAYIARTDTYIEKDLAINDRIDQMRLSATKSLLERRDVLIVASVSCIYGLGSPEFFKGLNLVLKRGEERRRDDLLLHLVEMQYKRSEYDFARGQFRVRGDILDIFPAYEEDLAYRVEFFGDEVERITVIDPLTGKQKGVLEEISIYPSSHHVTPEAVREEAVHTILAELEERKKYFEANDKLIERQRITERSLYDVEMIREIGFCKGIENYSRHFSKRSPGEPPACLLDYFPSDFLVFIDESHQTLPQLHAMCHGDRSRKNALIEYGFRLPSAYDNRPLNFEESWERMPQAVFVSATPGKWEIENSQGVILEQIIRPTGLLDPEIEIRPAKNQVDDALEEIRKETAKGSRVLVTTLTKKLSEELTNYLEELGVRARYLHSEIDTIERVEILRGLREGQFDVLVGINLLREGLDLPEVSLVIVLDADKEGFLRSETALIQTCGRAARNVHGRVVMYADKMTAAIKATLSITQKRRALQDAYNQQHGITPKSTSRDIRSLVPEMAGEALALPPKLPSIEELQREIKKTEKEMREAAKALNFEEAARLRDYLRALKKEEMALL